MFTVTIQAYFSCSPFSELHCNIQGLQIKQMVKYIKNIYWNIHISGEFHASPFLNLSSIIHNITIWNGRFAKSNGIVGGQKLTRAAQTLIL